MGGKLKTPSICTVNSHIPNPSEDNCKIEPLCNKTNIWNDLCTQQMARLIWVFAGCTCHFVGFVVLQLISGVLSYSIFYSEFIFIESPNLTAKNDEKMKICRTSYLECQSICLASVSFLKLGHILAERLGLTYLNTQRKKTQLTTATG